MKRFCLLLFLFLPFAHSLLGQSAASENIPHTTYHQAMELFELKQYGAARQHFNMVQRNSGSTAIQRKNAQYYEAICAMYLYNADGEKLIRNFVNEHPEHPKAKIAYFVLADFYFNEGNYRKSIEFFEMADLSNQKSENQVTGFYKLAYSYFSRRAFDEALANFNKIKRGNHAYTAASNYYSGFIYFNQNKLDQALTDLQKAESSESYAEVVPYMICNIYYKQKDLNTLISYGEKVLQIDNVRNRSDILLLVGDAYFLNNDFAKATEYFDEFTNTYSGDPEPKVLFRIAYTNYTSKKYDLAKPQFQSLSEQRDSLAQTAAFYLGNIYLIEEDLHSAALAFEKAVKYEGNRKLSEEAAFKLGKVYFTLENYADAIAVLTAFQEKFPNTTYKIEASELITESYLNTSNYNLAISYIEKIPNKSTRIRAAYQKVLFMKGAALYNTGSYLQAVQTFEKSVQFPEDSKVLAEAYYWMGETYSTGRRYEEAVKAYGQVLKISGADELTILKTQYGLGYAYFNQKMYPQALGLFQKYVNRTENSQEQYFYEDALLRLADCYYTTKTYKNAVNTYQKAIDKKVAETDYAYFQKGIVHSIMANNQQALEALDVVINKYPKSRYVEDATYHKGLIYFESGNYDQAINLFTKIMTGADKSGLLPYAYSKRAIAYYNKQEYNKTVIDYKFILNNYITHPVANEALLGLQEVLSLLKKSDELEVYLLKYKEANPDDKAVATVEFESAKAMYFDQKYNEAIISFQKYLQLYSGNTYSYDAKYYLADAYQRKGDNKKALEYYNAVIEDNRSSFVNRSLHRKAEIQYLDNKYSLAIATFTKLTKVATNKREQYTGWAGIMESYFMLLRYDSVESYAKLILEQGNVNANAENHANLFLGKTAMQKGDYEQANTYFINTVKSAKDKFSVEAKFLIATMQFNQKSHKASLETLFELNKEFTMFEEWVGKSFLLIADNFLELNERFQAKATLQSVIEKSSVTALVKEAQRKLSILDQEDRAIMEREKSERSEQNEDMMLFEEIDSLLNKNLDTDDN